MRGKRLGFSMAALLVIAGLLVVVAAVGYSMYFGNSSATPGDPKFERFKTAYATVRAGVACQLQMAPDGEAIFVSSLNNGTASDPSSRIGMLVEAGFLDCPTTQVENEKGEPLSFRLYDTGDQAALAGLPDLNKKLQRLHVRVSATEFDIDEKLGKGATLEKVWDSVKTLNP